MITPNPSADPEAMPKLSHPSPTRAGRTPLWRDLAPLCFIVFLEFLAMGLPLPVLPVHAHNTLGLGLFAVGLVIGVQSWATLLTRHAAGKRSDQAGPRSATKTGLLLSGLAGLLYALSGQVSGESNGLAILLFGRVLLGVGESLVITGALSWCIALAGRERSGMVMSWVGIAMYAALAIGSPLGSALAARFGFTGMSLAAATSPILAMGLLALVRNVEPVNGPRLPFYRVIGLIWLPGAGLAFSALGFASIAAFATLRFQEQGWPYAALAMSAFGAAYVVARLFFGGLPDRLGGARIAMASAAGVATGQLGMWLAASPGMAVAAAALTGFGFSLAFPSFGIEAMRRVPPASRGAALGAYSACFDLTLGVGVPLLGMIVGLAGYRAAFLVGGIAAFLSLLIAGLLFTSKSKRSP
jgi:MFS family permease